MPHQLRRIIAINIKNPSDSNPSGRISELDPRGGVLAVGDNGVGKTTFLRLIPLFYGATPSQVLKGSGKASMIRHTLPDPSSAVAYEYERESDANLRTVVMYSREGEDTQTFGSSQPGLMKPSSTTRKTCSWRARSSPTGSGCATSMSRPSCNSTITAASS